MTIVMQIKNIRMLMLNINKKSHSSTIFFQVQHFFYILMAVKI